MKLLIIIVNYRTPQLVIQCLHSLLPEIKSVNGRYKIVVVENGSGDNSGKQIEAVILNNNWNDLVKVVFTEKNNGFAAGNNIGIKSEKADAYLLLNSDTIVRPGAIEELVNALKNHPEVGIIAPRLEWPDCVPQISCFRDHSPIGEIINGASTSTITSLFKKYVVPIPVVDHAFEPAWVSFAGVLIRRKLIEEVGLLDEGYFMYSEDADYCRRARTKGWHILYWPKASVVHFRGGTSPLKSLAVQHKRLPKYYYTSRSRYFAKFYGRCGLWIANLLWTIGRFISLLRECIGNKKKHTCEHEFRDKWTNWLNPLKPPQHT